MTPARWLALLVLFAGASMPFTEWACAAASGWQRSALETLLPGFAVVHHGVQPVGAHVKLRSVLQNDSFVVLSGRVIAPGHEFSAEMPARSVPLVAALAVAGGLWVQRRRGWRLLVAVAALFAAAASLLVAVPPLVLAGTLWNLVSPDEAGRPSLEGLSIWFARLWLHGAGWAVALAVSAAALQRSASSRRPGGTPPAQSRANPSP